MRAEVRITAARRPDGTTAYPELRSRPPLTVRVAGDAVWLVGTAAGPLGADRVSVHLGVGAGAAVTVRSAAATVALAGASGGSELDVDVAVGEGGVLSWSPEPLVATCRCRHRSTARVRLAAGATLLWRDELVAGRTDEAPGSCRVGLAVDGPAGPVLRHGIGVGPDAPGWSQAAVLAGARAIGTVVVVGAPGLPAEPHRLPLGAALQPLEAGGVLVTALGPSAAPVRAALDEAVAFLLPQVAPLRSSA